MNSVGQMCPMPLAFSSCWSWYVAWFGYASIVRAAGGRNPVKQAQRKPVHGPLQVKPTQALSHASVLGFSVTYSICLDS